VRMDRKAFYGESFVGNAPSSYEEEERQRRNYAASWMLVHLLMHSSADYAVQVRELLAQPKHARTGYAIDALLRSVPEKRLDADLAAYLEQTIPWRQTHLNPRQPRAGYELRALNDAEVLTLWARLDDFDGPNAARAERRLREARQAAPGDPQVDLWFGRFVQRHPSEPTP